MSSPTDEDVAALEVHRAGPAERGEQARLFNRCFKKRVDEDDLAWRYDRNPHGEAVSLVFRPPGGEAVCSFAYVPRRAVSFGAPETEACIGQQGDVMTDPDWRRRGLVMRLVEPCSAATRERGWPLNWGFPNRQSASVFRKLGWETVGVIRPYDFYFRADAGARAERFREGRPRAALLPLVRLACVAGRRVLRRRARGRTERLERFPAEVEGLSRSVEERFPFMLRRDAAYLNWRFVDNPSGRHRSLGVFDDGGALVGYAVVQRPAEGGGIGYVVDLLGADAAAVSAALAAALDELQTQGAVLARATAVDGSWWARVLSDAGFLRPKPENHLFVYAFVQDAGHPLAAVARDASAWYLTDGDRDDELMG